MLSCYNTPTKENFMDKLRIGLIGLGTVGSGVYKSLQNFDNVEIVKIAVRNIT